jgi:acyl carrier protein
MYQGIRKRKHLLTEKRSYDPEIEDLHMDKAEILQQINGIFIDVLDDDGVIISEATTANDVDGWDSLTHIQLVVAVEKHFKCRFTSKEIQNWNNVGEMIASIVGK